MSDVAVDMVSTIVKYGLPFMEANSSLDGILCQIDQSLGHFLEYRRPVVLSLLGRHADAIQDIERACASMSSRVDPAADELRAFADALLQSIGGMG